MFEDAGEASAEKSRELQNQNRDGLDKKQVDALALEARYWSSAATCAMHLQEATADGV